MKNKIKEELDKYLEFDSSNLICDPDLTNSRYLNPALFRIFGGSIRDIICGDKINDVDIICGSKSIEFIEGILKSNSYNYIESLTPKDLSSIYSDIHIINEPHTWMKGLKIVQLIRPAIGYKMSEEDYKRGLSELVSNVDISCCGVSYDCFELYEDYPNAISHCQNKIFTVNENAKMYSEKRVIHRVSKFTQRGWKEIEK